MKTIVVIGNKSFQATGTLSESLRKNGEIFLGSKNERPDSVPVESENYQVWELKAVKGQLKTARNTRLMKELSASESEFITNLVQKIKVH